MALDISSEITPEQPALNGALGLEYARILTKLAGEGKGVMDFRTAQIIRTHDPSLEDISQIISGCVDAVIALGGRQAQTVEHAQAIASYAKLGSQLLCGACGVHPPSNSIEGLGLNGRILSLRVISAEIAGTLSIDAEISEGTQQSWHAAAVAISKFAWLLEDAGNAALLENSSFGISRQEFAPVDRQKGS